MAAELSLAGFKVNLVELPQFEYNLTAIRKRGGIQISGLGREALVMPNMVTTDVRKAITEADVIMFTVPAYGRRSFLDACVRHLRTPQILVFNTGYYAGLQFYRELEKKGAIVSETASLLYLCRLIGPAHLFLDGVKRFLQIAAIPASDTGNVTDALKDVYPQLTPASNVLETSLGNQNAVFHIPVYLANKGCLERDGKERSIPVVDAVTPSVARLMDSIDAERRALSEELRIDVLSIGESITRYYGTEGRSTYELVHNCKPYATYTYDFKNGQNPYVKEDWSYGLAPMASLSDVLKVPTPVIDSLITMGSIVDGADYWSEGLTAEKLGLDGLDQKQMVQLANEGANS